jgi:hypothetical protein
MKTNRRYRFNICNFYQNKSPFEFGMRPIYFSDKAFKDRSVGWQRIGENVSYFKTQSFTATRSCSNHKGRDPLYTLSFSLEFLYAKDTIYIAYNQPYTYTQLRDFISKSLTNSYPKLNCKREEIAKSLAGNSVDILIITEESDHIIPKIPKRQVEAPVIKELSELEKIDLTLGISSNKNNNLNKELVPKFLKKMQDKADEEERERLRQRDLLIAVRIYFLFLFSYVLLFLFIIYFLTIFIG